MKINMRSRNICHLLVTGRIHNRQNLNHVITVKGDGQTHGYYKFAVCQTNSTKYNKYATETSIANSNIHYAGSLIISNCINVQCTLAIASVRKDVLREINVEIFGF